MFKGNLDRNRSAWTVDPATSSESVTCTNTQYRFVIEKASASKWILTELEFVDEPSDLVFTGERTPNSDSSILNTIRGGFRPNSILSIRQVDLERIVSDPGFVTESISEPTDGIVEVKCLFTLHNVAAEGKLLFEATDWLYLGCDIKLNNATRFSQTISYDSDRLPIQYFHSTVKILDGDVLESVEVSYDRSKVRQSSPVDFRLSFFGLPEPEGVRWGWPPAVWISIIGILLLGIVVLRRTLRKGKRS